MAASLICTISRRIRRSPRPATAYGYDKDGNQISVTDPDHNTTTYQFDAVGQLTSMTTPLGTTPIGAVMRYSSLIRRQPTIAV